MVLFIAVDYVNRFGSTKFMLPRKTKIKVLGGGGVGEETLFQKGPSPTKVDLLYIYIYIYIYSVSSPGSMPRKSIHLRTASLRFLAPSLR